MASPLRVGQRVVEGHVVVALGEAAERVHMGVGQLFRPSVGVELTAGLGELFAGVEV